MTPHLFDLAPLPSAPEPPPDPTWREDEGVRPEASSAPGGAYSSGGCACTDRREGLRAEHVRSY